MKYVLGLCCCLLLQTTHAQIFSKRDKNTCNQPSLDNDQFYWGDMSRVWNFPHYDKQWIHFGYIISFNQYDYNLVRTKQSFLPPDSLYSLSAEGSGGFGLGLIVNLHLSDRFDLRFLPSLVLSGQRSLNYGFYDASTKSITTNKKFVQSTFVEFPLLLKYKSDRYNNFRMYVVGGAKYSIDMHSNKKIKNTISGNKIKIERDDISAELGVGMDFYLPYFKFSPELRVSYGIKNNMIYGVKFIMIKIL